MKLAVARLEGDDKLTRQVWEADLTVEHSIGRIVLNYWGLETRPTTRHKWRAESQWYRIASRPDRLNSVSKPEIPEDVQEELREQACAVIRAIPVRLSY